VTNPRVKLTHGVVEGRSVGGVNAFLGIPYAAAPVDDNRLRAPQSVLAWDGVREAGEYGPTAPKGDYPPAYQALFPEVVIPGPDCLNLNVWAPAAHGGGLPVLVWIHGGSFMNGSGSIPQYDGSAFARDGVVCVTINYRLSAQGFLYLGDSAAANLGLLDQVAALRWVRDNIAAFGGDPDLVTIAGESAGAMSVTTLLSMPIAAGLFSQAITQSGAAAHALTAEQGLMVSERLAEVLGVAQSREAFSAVPVDTFIKAASDLVVEVQTSADPERWGAVGRNQLPFAPVIDGTVVPGAPLEAIANGSAAGVRLLVGTTRDEARLFTVAPGLIDYIDEPTLEHGAAGYGIDADALAVYRTNRPQASPGDILSAVITDWFFRIPAIRVAEAHAGTETWMYRFDYPEPADNHGLGASHAVEVPFVFDTVDIGDTRPLLGDTPSPVVAEAAHRTWVRFITDGEPGWDPYDTDRRTTALLTETVEVADDPAADERQLWDGIR
jgi:para-nitrobenzyl esterase